MQVVDLTRPAAITCGTLPEIHDTPRTLSTAAPNLWERIAIECRTRHYKLGTERSYVRWAQQLVLFHGRTHPSKLTSDQVQAFLNHLAVDKRCAPSTCKQALCALLFLYRHVLQRGGFGVVSPLDRMASGLMQPAAPAGRPTPPRTCARPGLRA